MQWLEMKWRGIEENEMEWKENIQELSGEEWRGGK